MMRQLSFAAVLPLTVALFSPTLLRGQPTLQQIVNGFYPLALEPAGPSERRTCFTVYSMAADGSPAVILAGYTNTVTAAVRVITKTDVDPRYQVTYEVPASYNLIGTDCSVNAVDVNFDGQRELHFSFSGRKGVSDWIFGWDGTQLKSLTPTTLVAGGQSSLLSNASLYDLAHAGALQIVCPGSDVALQEGRPVERPMDLYQMVDGVYRRTGHLVTIDTFRAGALAAFNVAHFWKSTDSEGPYVLRLVNGDRNGQNRATGGTISLNGEVVIDASQLSSVSEFIEITFSTLPIENRLVASLTGDQSATVIVTVSDSTDRK